MQFKVSFLDCKSHGDCTVITFKDRSKKACIVIDGGEGSKGGKALREYLEQENVDKIDLMIGTHIDSDHIYGLYFFVRDELKKMRRTKPNMTIKEFWGPLPSESHTIDLQPADMPEITALDDADSWQRFVIQSVAQNDNLYDLLAEEGVVIKHPARDNIIENPFRSVDIDLLGPDTQIPADHIRQKALTISANFGVGKQIKSLGELKDAINENRLAMAIAAKRNANNQSIVIRIRPKVGKKAARAWSFLLTGDAEEEAWAEMLDEEDVKKRLKAKVLKIPHHGSSENGITDDGAAAVAPEYSVNMVGQKHGLPDKETMVRLKTKNHSEILCTQRNDSTKKKSDCYDIIPADCPAKNNPQTVSFAIDTESGTFTITPDKRNCLHSW